MCKTRDRDTECRMEHFQGYVSVEKSRSLHSAVLILLLAGPRSLRDTRAASFPPRLDDWPGLASITYVLVLE
jgi:hypothetical protein